MKETIYKIKAGDSIEKIANIFCIDKKMICPQNFEVGDRVIINLQHTKCYVVMPGDTIESIAYKLDIKQDDLVKMGVEPLFVGKHLIF